MNHIESPSKSKKHIIWILCMILALSFFASSSYRGIAHDGALGGYENGARRILAGQPLYDGSGDAVRMPARFLYIALIALGYKILGFNLLASHISTFLFQVVNPLLFFWLSWRFTKNVWWSAIGACFFIFHAFDRVFLNQQYEPPIFMFFLLLLVILLDMASEEPRWLVLAGVVSLLLVLTRFEEAGMFLLFLYGVYLFGRWKTGLPIKWLLLSIVPALAIYCSVAMIFGFPILFPLDYFPALFARQANYGASSSFLDLTRSAFRSFTNWYLGGKYMMPFIAFFVALGTLHHFKKRLFYPIALFWPHFLFVLLVYNARGDIMNLGLPYSVPGFILLLFCGVRTFSTFCAELCLKISQYNVTFLKKLGRSVVFQVIILLSVAVFLGRSTRSLMIVANDVIPASTMWRIVKNNPPMPGNPSFKETFIQLNREEQFPVLFREELYRTVRGDFRPWYAHRVGKEAFERGLPEKAEADADFVYADNYETSEKWKRDRVHFEGESTLWNEEHSGRIGAFPYGKSASFIYKFEFPEPVDYLTLSDIHSQWGFNDRTKMWTSLDGENWTLRYDRWNVRNLRDPYYQFFEDEFDGARTLFVKYYFYAGDKTRAADDNRGACLEEFSLAVKYQ